MSFADIQRAALALKENERAELAACLLESLPLPEYIVDDDEVARRESELEQSNVRAISQEEFERHVRANRRRLS